MIFLPSIVVESFQYGESRMRRAPVRRFMPTDNDGGGVWINAQWIECQACYERIYPARTYVEVLSLAYCVSCYVKTYTKAPRQCQSQPLSLSSA